VILPGERSLARALKSCLDGPQGGPYGVRVRSQPGGGGTRTATNGTPVVAYLRVSSEKQASDGLSLEVQHKRVRAHCELHELNLVSIETDAGRSAGSLRRPALERALQMLRDGKAEGLVVVKLDRLTRRLKDLLQLVEDYFDTDKGGSHLISLSETVDTRTPHGKAMIGLLGVFAEWERDMARARTREVMDSKKERGEHLGGEAPYGFSVVAGDDGVSRLAPNEIEQTAMREARVLRGQLDCSLQAIADTFNEDGIPRRNKRPWTRQAIGRLLE